MTVFYLILFLISFFYLFILLYKFGQSTSIYYYLLSICIILINFGYWQGCISTTLEEMLATNRASYLGAAFVSYFMVCSIAQLTKTKIPTPLRVIGIGLGIAVTAFAMTIGHSTLYYKSTEFIQINGFSYLVKEYGPMHNLFIIEIVLALLYGFLMVAVAFTKGKKVSYISCIGSLSVMLCVTIVYFIKGSIYQMLPLAYDIGFAVILILLMRIRLYNPIGLSEQSLKDSQDFGFVSFDSKGHFLDGNTIARKWFPELNDLKIDRLIPSYNSYFLKQVHPVFQSLTLE